MLYQLPSGRTIELSLDQYLDMTDDELKELDCLSESHTMDMNDPFYKPYSKGKALEVKPLSADKKYGVDNVSNDDKLRDEYFNRDDI
jgi:hypothetical protein|tara:strand:- start:200 stop:460 length:261 start_codon:yes stop_codon:yes gene_type:complete